MKIEKKKTAGILVFENVEVLDFAGPFEVFQVANDLADSKLWDVNVCSWDSSALSARYGLQIIPDSKLENSTGFDVILIPGGRGVRAILADQEKLERLRKVITNTTHIISVCTGSLLLAKLGLLNGKKATTHFENRNELQKIGPELQLVDQRYVDNGRILCAEGVSAGIDVALYYVAREAGEELAEKTAKYMMYNGKWKTPTI